MKLNLLLLFLLAGFASFGQQISKSLTASNGRFIGFLEYKPTEYQASNQSLKYPLIIFLHGIGERGNGTTDLSKVAANGIPKNIKYGHPMRFTWNGKTETFLVLTPQLSSDYGSWQNFYVEEMIQYAKSNLNIDTNRIILTGLSLGGGSVWGYPISNSTNTKKLAAIGISCGVKPSGNYKNITDNNLPVWAFHATDDPTVSVTSTTSIIQTLNSYNPAVPPYQTIWPNGGHAIWNRVFDTTYKYQNPNIYEWFLAQNKSYAVNKRPTPIASDVSALSGTGTAKLDASRSTDADGTIQRIIWTQISGPVTTTLTNAVSKDGICNVSGATTNGVYQYEVKVVDNRADYKLDTISLTVSGNRSPISVAGPNQVIALPTSSVVLNGSSSSDPDGTITKYNWVITEGPSGATIANANVAGTSVTGLQLGIYKFRLTVTDNMNATAESFMTVTVNPQPANIAPTARAGNDDTLTAPVGSVMFDGSASSDKDGKIVKYKWTKSTGPSSYKIVSPDSVKTSILNLVEGTYKFKLTVFDDRGDSSIDNHYVVVKPAIAVPNEQPVSVAGAPQSITLPVSSVVLNGKSSSDPDGTITKYNWSQVEGPSGASITHADSAITTVTTLKQGIYKFKLTVTDNLNSNADSYTTVTVNPAPNQVPVSNAGATQLITLPVSSVVLDGSSSSDPDGTIVKYHWSQAEGPSTALIAQEDSASTTVSSLIQGEYKFKLTVTDNLNSTSDSYTTITVNQVTNKLPVSVAGIDQSIILPESSVVLDGRSSSDPDGTITKYHWSQVEGPSAAIIASADSSSTQVTSLQEGVYKFQLTVTDNLNTTSDSYTTITVRTDSNILPVSVVGADQDITLPVSFVDLDGSSSIDPDGTIIKYNWSQIEGPSAASIANAESATTSVSGLQEGIYRFRLIVTDNMNISSENITKITVNQQQEANILPTARAGNDDTLYAPKNTVTFDGSASGDKDGKIVRYKWVRLSGPSSYKIISPDSVITSVTNLVEGAYKFRLIVFDDRGDSAFDNRYVTVKPPLPNDLPISVAGTSQVITLPVSSVALDGSSSLDPDGTIIKYHWSLAEGPSAAIIAHADSARTTVSALQAGIYNFRLTVTDNMNMTSEAYTTVTVNLGPNSLPKAKAGNDDTLVAPISSVNFDGSGSYDRDGKIVQYKWVKIQGPSSFKIESPDSVKTAVSNLQEGTYKFRLTVVDDRGDSAIDNHYVIVKPAAKTGAARNLNSNNRENNLHGSFSIFPNPATSNITIQFNSVEEGNALITIFNSNGQMVQAKTIHSIRGFNQVGFNVQNLRKGSYMVRIVNGKEAPAVQQLVIQ